MHDVVVIFLKKTTNDSTKVYCNERDDRGDGDDTLKFIAGRPDSDVGGPQLESHQNLLKGRFRLSDMSGGVGCRGITIQR